MYNDIKRIKKKYGEKMMHLCKELFPTILDISGRLPEILEQSFEPSKFLYEDIIRYKKKEMFKDYIYSLFLVGKTEIKQTNKTPQELMDDAGYNLYECKTEADIQKFEKYYEVGEKICTFNGGRLNRSYVFFAVKKNVDEIKREDSPRREDSYGTSVISIQFSRGKTNTLAIMNRYNHTLDKYTKENPDATFSNNLENIIPGLTDSFKKTYGYNFEYSDLFELPGYVKAHDGKYYKFNYVINGIYYCPNNIIIDNYKVIRDYKSERYLLIDYFLIDMTEKTIQLYDKNIVDSFKDTIGKISKIDIITCGNEKEINIICENKNQVNIKIDKYNRIISYKNEHVEIIGDGFLRYASSIENINIMNTVKLGKNSLEHASSLKTLELQNLQQLGQNSLRNVNQLISINMPKLSIIEENVLENASLLEHINIENATILKDNALQNADTLTIINLPNVIELGNFTLKSVNNLKKIYLPKVEKIGNFVLSQANNLVNLELPNLIQMGHCSLQDIKNLLAINMPKITILEQNTLENANNLISITIPNVTILKSNVLRNTESLSILNIPNVEELGACALQNAKNIIQLDLPKIIKIETRVLEHAHSIVTLNIPNVKEIGDCVLRCAQNLQVLLMPKNVKIGFCFLANNQYLSESLNNEDDLLDSNIVNVKPSNNKLASNIISVLQNGLKIIKQIRKVGRKNENSRTRK